MTSGTWIAIIGLGVTFGLTIIGHLIVSVFWAGKVTAKLDILIQESSGTKAKLEAFQQTCFTKAEASTTIIDRDAQHKALWAKIDALKKAVTRILQKEGMDITKEEI